MDVLQIKDWSWDARFQTYTRLFDNLGHGCVSKNLASSTGTWSAAYGGEMLCYYDPTAKYIFDSPSEAAKAVEDFARSRGWPGIEKVLMYVRYCPGCGARELNKQEVGPATPSDTSNLGYDVYCRVCEWSGDILPDVPPPAGSP